MSVREHRETTRRLVFLDDVRQGAEIALPENSATTLGADIGRDIVLSAPGLADHQLTIVVEDGVAMLEAEAEGVRRDDEALEPGRRHRCDPGAVYAVGAVRFAIMTDDRGVGAGTSPGGASSDASFLADDDALVSRPHAAADRHEVESKRLLARLLGGGLALVVLLSGGSYAWHSVTGGNDGDGAPERVEAPPLPTRLARAGFVDLDVRVGDGDRAVIGGYVASRARLLELQRFLSLVEPAPRVAVFVQGEIVEGVGDVFRTHGIDATVEPLEPGMVRVSTAEREIPDFRALQQAAIEDVPGLRAVQAKNTAPAEPEVKETRTRVPRTPPGKRVVAVIEGDPSYVVTEDDARYFVGSSLPTGHTIAMIEGRSVTLDRDGERTQLDF